jgi:hypothetical protein
MAAIAAARPVTTVRVVPSDDAMRRLLAHPSAGRFRAQGAATWPKDRYTNRRLAEGSIKLESEGDKPKPHQPHQQHQQHPRGGDAA